MFGKFKGKKTYITAGLTVIGAIAGYFTGDMELSASIQLIVTAVLGATVRHGLPTTAE